MNFKEIGQVALALLTQFGLKLVGAILLWVVAQRLIDFGLKLLRRAFKVQHVDPTLITYIINIISVTLRIVLVVAILGFFGIETTSFAALLAAAGIAIGAAWGGLLANFAAGAFLVIFRPFKIGDFISAAGVTGTVTEIGLFTTNINTPDNVMTIVANNKIFSDNIQNYSANPYRRVDLLAQLHHSVDHHDAIARLKAKISQIPNVLQSPAPDVEIIDFNMAGPVLAVRPYCNNDHYWQVYFDTNKVIRETFGEAGYPVPEHRYSISSPSSNGVDPVVPASIIS
ncbi:MULTISPECIES: mechanosensitive ion channel family protein [unclassified Tolypothrix]|uniref:mechanosensitive ion channel family protein n=1 Tax=unclassified Tolypothrix TaxID=2649714 RepID=UPI0005EAA9C3|nr:MULTISPECIES: mechanosensitive ion channel family protein [unclassified Tolypothrix]BAY94850.1 MscS mechanosensitive ion channel [Microchaete diplosiphon NIES-3275]EKF04250.1 transporter, small conductance mechanosensitive ion channel family protein [Tolypothrix sp. PCC 7601]MBE9085160.1 mechanosensitive ion channel family protein [Tolypothrix sp. LEGE 11397]UYD28499.1 mechanosensitive ion channel family protein [Tolypothrix sp. PCC 7712]UYD35589.1 mechanosensitive ion channel family protei